MNNYGFGNFIYELRTEKEMSQSELGELLGVSNKAVSKWETGAAVPRPEKLTKLAEIFGVTVAELLCAKRAEKENGDGEVSYAIGILVREYRRAKAGLAAGLVLFLLSPLLMLLVLGIAWATGDVYSQWAVILLVLCFLLHIAGEAGVIVFFLLTGKRKRMMYTSFPHRKEEISARSHTLPPAKTGKLAIVVLCGFLLMLLAVEAVLCAFGVLDKSFVGIVTLCGVLVAAVGNVIFVRLWWRRIGRHKRAGKDELAVREGKFLLEAWLPSHWSVAADVTRLGIASSCFALGDDENFLFYLGEVVTAGGKIAASYWRCLSALAQGGRAAFLAEYDADFLPLVRKSDRGVQKTAEYYGERLRLLTVLATGEAKEEDRQNLLSLVENPRARKLIEAL